MPTRTPSEGVDAAGARALSWSYSARTHGPHGPAATAAVCQDCGSCGEPSPAAAPCLQRRALGASLHNWLPGSCPLVPLWVLRGSSLSPHQNSLFPHAATAQQGEGLVLRDGWTF